MAAHLFVADLDDLVVLPEDLHHAERVLRLRDGEPLTVTDGAGKWRNCAWRRGGYLTPTSEVHVDLRPQPLLTVGFALTKGDKGALIVQKLTECGVDLIMPIAAERSIVRWTEDKATAAVERWRRIAREAAMQSHRTWLPTVTPVLTATEVLKRPGVAVADARGAPLSARDTTVVVGPEGGWTADELSLAERRVALATHTLRAETAAVAAATLLSAIRARLVAPVGAG